MVSGCDVYCGRGGGYMGVYLDLVDNPILFAVCMALGVIVASALCIWISLRRKK